MAAGFIDDDLRAINVDTKKSRWSWRSRRNDEMLTGPAGRGRRFLMGAV
jgi:hypothetical protein